MDKLLIETTQKIIKEQVNAYKMLKSFYQKGNLNEMLSTIPINLEKIDKHDIDREILRVSILAELDATNLYEQFAAYATDPKLKKILLDVAKEEKTHVGEFQSYLNILDKQQAEETINGAKEVAEM